ncbi:MAG: hypothetical protein SOX43_07950 [Pelistega sp.]|nr:hypothetical protein [Pelistega sp.]
MQYGLLVTAKVLEQWLETQSHKNTIRPLVEAVCRRCIEKAKALGN